MAPIHVRLLAGTKSSGEPVLEAVPAAPAGQPQTFVLTATPGLATGCAAGDVVRVANDGTFIVSQRGGNLGVQVVAPAETDETGFASLTAAIESLGGYLDGGSDSPHTALRVFTVPVAAGFLPVEAALNAFVEQHPDATWSYANVYDPEDGITPLGWWEQ